MDIDINAVFDQTIRKVNSIADDVLDLQSKRELLALLDELKEVSGGHKEAKGHVARKILKWLGDKATDVLVAAVPYIAAVLQAA